MKTIALSLLVAFSTAALAADEPTNEVLVLTTATRVDVPAAYRKGLEIQNLGPNAIFCALKTSAKAVVNKARKINAGDAWAVDVGNEIPVYCIASTANQVTTAATIVTEVR